MRPQSCLCWVPAPWVWGFPGHFVSNRQPSVNRSDSCVLVSSTPAPPLPSPGEMTTPPCPSYSGHGSGVTLTLTPPILHTPHPTRGQTCRCPLQSSSDHFSVAHRLQSRSRVLLLPCPKACSHAGKGPSSARVLSPPTVCSPSWL